MKLVINTAKITNSGMSIEAVTLNEKTVLTSVDGVSKTLKGWVSHLSNRYEGDTVEQLLRSVSRMIKNEELTF